MNSIIMNKIVDGQDVRKYGALGDGKSDDTQAVERALAALPKQGGVVYFPPGHYLLNVIRTPAHVTFLAHSAWGYRDVGASFISPVSDDQPCIFDATGAIGVRFTGLSLDGGRRGACMHGIVSGRGKCEQNLVVDDCRIADFSGSGLQLNGSHVWIARHSLFFMNCLDGINADSACDGWVIDCQIVANGRAGIHALAGMPSVTITGNRIEHNGIVHPREGSSSSASTAGNQIKHKVRGGIVVGPNYVEHVQITGNCFCTNYGPAVDMSGEDSLTTGGRYPSHCVAITGNQFRYSGRNCLEEPRLDCHLRLADLSSVTVTGNTFYTRIGRTPQLEGPSTAIILKNLRDSVITGNTLWDAATKQLIADEGQHDQLIIEHNPGRLVTSHCPT